MINIPQAILFDVGLVLMAPDSVRIADAMKGRFGIDVPPKCYTRAYRHTIYRRDVSYEPDMSDSWFWTSWCRDVGLAPDLWADVLDVIRELELGRLWTSVAEDTIPTLRTLAKMGIKLGIVANTDGGLNADLRSTNMLEYFSAAIDSEEVGISKPDPEAFLSGLRALGVAACSAWFVGDDMLHDICPALLLGFDQAIHFDPLCLYGKPEKHLRISRLFDLTEDLLAGARRRPVSS